MKFSGLWNAEDGRGSSDSPFWSLMCQDTKGSCGREARGFRLKNKALKFRDTLLSFVPM